MVEQQTLNLRVLGSIPSATVMSKTKMYIIEGVRVLWEDWAGPQIVKKIYNYGTETFAELTPADSSSKSIGHDVYLDELELE